MRIISSKGLSLVFVVSVFSGCRVNSTQTKLQYMPDMADSPTVKAQENYLEPPEGSVQIDGILYPDSIEESAKLLQNPYESSDEILAEGKALWDTFCITCHGPEGKGDNALGEDKYPPVPNITEGGYTEYADGHIFHRITFGGALMPAYGHAISADERWKIVHYLKELQKKK